MSVLPLARNTAVPEDDEAPARVKPKKAPTAFRTISEVADDLHIPQHVLRFWETKFPQVRPLKRGGGRRYYRPDDITLLRRISHLLYTQGYTIKGVQRLLREGGGRLADDIPPPLQDDQDTEADHEAEQLLVEERARIEERAETAAAAGRLPLRFIPRSAAQPPLPPVASAAPAAAEQEAARLRRALADLLSGLEGLRILLER
jgi:DNA-binding transcriptional MerR regulator